MPYPVWNANTDTCSYNGGARGFGVAGGKRWCPAHCDAVLRRHFWFWDAQSYNHSTNLNSPSRLLAMHLTSVGRGCNMILDMSPTTTGLLQSNDVDTYARFGEGQRQLYVAPLAASTSPSLPRGQKQFELWLPYHAPPVTRGAIELRENMTLGQTIANYSVEACAHRTQSEVCAQWQRLPLRNEPCLTIGNRRIQTFGFDGPAHVTAIRVTLQPLLIATQGEATLTSQEAEVHLRGAKLFDWSSKGLDAWLTDIARVQ